MQKGPREASLAREIELMVWRLIQLSVVFGVLASNIRYGWTPNPYAVSVVAFLAALFVTAIPIMISDLLRLADRGLRLLLILATPSERAPATPERYRAAPATRVGLRDRPVQDAT